jgi:hypothetical protein
LGNWEQLRLKKNTHLFWRNLFLSNAKPKIEVNGKPLGIAIVVSFQVLIGVVHLFFGSLMLASEVFPLASAAAYDVYTLLFGLTALVFAVFLWGGVKLGWLGAVALSVLVAVVDSLVLLDLPSVPGVPKSPALVEIGYSLLIICCMSTRGVRSTFFRGS